MKYLFKIALLLAVFPFVTGQGTSAGPSVKLSTGRSDAYNRLDYNGECYLFEVSIETVDLDFSPGNPGYFHVRLSSAYGNGEEGSPSLPRITRLFEADVRSTYRIRMEALDSVVFDLAALGIEGQVIPHMPSVRKGDSIHQAVADSIIYGNDAWIGGPVLSTTYEGSMRDVIMSSLHFNPVHYNPARKLLKVYRHVKCRIETAKIPISQKSLDPAFAELLGRVVRQAGPAEPKALRTEQPMTLVILSDTVFREALRPYVSWKVRKGFRVIELYRHDPLAGSSSESIRAAMKSLYQAPPEGFAPPSYLLIVGDVQYIPRSQSTGQITDLYYATCDVEGDYLPDLFYGRISVDSVSQLQGVLDKILEYEQYAFPDPAFLDESVLIAGVDGSYASTYGNGHIRYARENYLQPEEGYTAHMFPYPESDTSAHSILQLISSGVGFVNYTGHGQWDRWLDPAFRIADIAGLQNRGKYPVMIGNGCETNVFTLDECFAEALIRAPEEGALAYIGCTNDSYWDEDFFWAVGVGPVSDRPEYGESSPGYYDRVFHTHGEAYEIWTPSLGEMVFGGNMAVQASSSYLKKFYWEIYQLAGDPTLVPWFRQPKEQPVSHPPSLPPGMGRLDLHAVPNAYAALSCQGVLLDAKHSSQEGLVTLHLPDTLEGQKLDLMISAGDYLSYEASIEVGASGGPFLDLLHHELADESVEADGNINPLEHFSLGLHLMNRGVTAIHQDTLVLFSGQDGVEVTDSLVYLEKLEAGDSLVLENVFTLEAVAGLPDQARIFLGMHLKGASHSLYLEEIFQAPVLLSEGIRWDDRPAGNGNGIMEAGEWISGSWALRNTGHFRTGPVLGDPAEGSLLQDLYFDGQPVLLPAETVEVPFLFRIDSLSGKRTAYGILQAGDGTAAVTDSFRISVGRYLEDFSGGTLERFPFRNDSERPWEPDPSTYASPGYSLRSGLTGHLGSSTLSMGLECEEADSLSFAFRVSSENRWDCLVFTVDSLERGRWSGERDWQVCQTFLEAGSHVLSWSYRKDGNISRGEDAAWIDDIRFPEGAFRKGDLSLVEILNTASGPRKLEGEALQVRVRNTSMDTVRKYLAVYSLNGEVFSRDSLNVQLLPGEEAVFASAASPPLNDTGNFVLGAEILSDSLGYLGNNALLKEVSRYAYPDLALEYLGEDHEPGVYADLHISVSNLGNVPRDSLYYDLWFNSMLRESGARHIGLLPGEQKEEHFRMADSVLVQESGTYPFLLANSRPDSVSANDRVEGFTEWRVLGMESGMHEPSWHLHPNPVRDLIVVSLEEPADRDLHFHLLDLRAQVMGSCVLQAGEGRIPLDVHFLAPGTYLLREMESGTCRPVVILPR